MAKEVKSNEGATKGGLEFERVTGDIRPPGQEAPGEEAEVGRFGEPTRVFEPVREAKEEVLRAGKIPLHPAVIRLPASILGRVGFEVTGYPGFIFTEQELNDLATLWMLTGVEMPPMLQAAIGTTAMLGGKALGYFAWVKAGKPKAQVPPETLMGIKPAEEAKAGEGVE